VRFPFNAYLAAVLSAAATTAITLPLWRRWVIKAGLVDAPGERKIHHEPIPLAGGLAVMTGLALPTLAAALLIWLQSGGAHFDEGSQRAYSGDPLTERSRPVHDTPVLKSESAYLLRHGLDVRAWRLAGILFGAAGMLLVGVLDDRHELRPWPKFLGQLAVGIVVAASGARITLFVHNMAFSYLVTVLWILTLINAFNFMDNMNGLCAGVGAIGAGCFGIIAATSPAGTSGEDRQYLVAILAFLACGAMVGFLPWNFPRARAFLGDGGSHLVGYLLAVLAILPHFYTPAHPVRWAVLKPLIVLAIPLADLVWVVLHRASRGQPFYVGDTNHFSHRLVQLGFTKTNAVLAIWLAAVVCGALACALI
jgi:UDP-GlcNAc:undecaprenyl-phosphate GlcNAc-1-phosphate transferase